MTSEWKEYLQPTVYMDFDHPDIQAFIHRNHQASKSNEENLIHLYYVVRDDFPYDPYDVDLSVEGLKASHIVQKGKGYCVEKANLYASCARALGIPARLGFMDVINHLSSPKLLEALRSNIFAFHGYAELWIDHRWVKATPAFNRSLCERLGVAPLDFDGKNDAVFQEFQEDRQFMEYVHDHGTFSDIPRDYMIEVLNRHYPHLFSKDQLKTQKHSLPPDGLFQG